MGSARALAYWFKPLVALLFDSAQSYLEREGGIELGSVREVEKRKDFGVSCRRGGVSYWPSVQPSLTSLALCLCRLLLVFRHSLFVDYKRLF